MKLGLTFTARNTELHLDGDAEEEFDSPETIAAIAAALTALGHEIELLGDGQPLARRLLAGSLPELVFNIAEGRGIGRNRESWVPALLEMFGIPYTGSDPLTLAAALDKDLAKRLVQAAGVAVPQSVLIDALPQSYEEGLSEIPLPVVVKPAFEGSSKGITAASLIDDPADLPAAIAHCQQAYQQSVLVEEFIDGDELTVGLLGNAPPEILGIMRVVPLEQNAPFLYDLDVKRDWRRRVRYEVPAQLDRDATAAVQQAALAALAALGCRDVARIDFRLRRGVPYFLEANPLPGLTPGSSDLVLMAEFLGIGYQQLISRILAAACERISQRQTAPAAVPVLAPI